MDIHLVSFGEGTIFGAVVSRLWTGLEWLFKRYILEPRLQPALDRSLKPYTKSSLQHDLDELIAHMAADWATHHTLPNPLVYQPLYNKISINLKKYISTYEYDIFNTQFKTVIFLISLMDRPTNTELRDLQHQIETKLVPVLERIKAQLGPQ